MTVVSCSTESEESVFNYGINMNYTISHRSCRTLKCRKILPIDVQISSKCIDITLKKMLQNIYGGVPLLADIQKMKLHQLWLFQVLLS